MKERPKTEVWSCGGGTQSGAISALIATGRLPRPDMAFMTDTGYERSSTWPFVDGFIRPNLRAVGLDLTIVKAAEFASVDVFWENNEGGKTILLPGFSSQSGSVGKLSPFCSGKWKRDVGERWMRSKGISTARNWIGISIDEARRIRAKYRGWLDLWYPLISEVRMKRADCIHLIHSEGWTGEIPHSSCFMCPNHSDIEWADMRRDWPADFAAACALESEIRTRDAHFWLHPQCVPLAEVEFSAQQTMFSDRGCYGGCFT
jgi:hypothetical protein